MPIPAPLPIGCGSRITSILRRKSYGSQSRRGLAEGVSDYQAFTDIEFNPAISINCQAYAVALYVSSSKRGLLCSATFDKATFLQLVEGRPIGDRRQNDSKQGLLL